MTASDSRYIEKNMGLLKKNHPAVYRIVSKDEEYSNKTEVVLSKSQKRNLKVTINDNEEIFIHDPDDPGIEADNFLSIVPENSTGVVLMFGMGLGYSVLELFKKRKKLQYIIVFEMNVEFFMYALQYMDFSDLLADKRLHFCLGEPENLSSFMAPANKALMLENAHTLKLQTCFRVNSAYEKLSSESFDYINALNTEGATKSAYGRTFFENRLKHLTSMHHDKKLEDLVGKFEGIPAIIVAAGPSLDKNINLISKAVGKAVIISVDTSLTNLLDHGVKPDFITAIDYNELTHEKIFSSASNPVCRQINLICTSWVANSVTKQFPARNRFWAFSNNAQENWINISLGGKMAIGGAGTVAHLNFIAANIMGCDPIIFVGQDLAFSNSRGHSSNVVLNSDQAAKKMIDDGQDIMWVRGVVEDQVPTNRQMFGYKSVFDKMIKESDRLVINSTEGGALLEGAENMPLIQAIEKFCKIDIDIDVPDHAHGFESPLKSMESTLNELKKLEKIIQKADKLSGPIKKKLLSLGKNTQTFFSFSDLPAKLQKKIIDLETCHNKADKNKLWSIFDETTMEGLRQNERKIKEIEKLEGIPEKYFQWLAETVERIDAVNQIRKKNLIRFKKQLIDLVEYFTKEKLRLEQIKKGGINLNDLLELAKLYFQSGDYVLLEKTIDSHDSEIVRSNALLNYFYGVIALSRGDYETAENQFQLSVNCDASYTEKIDKKRNEIADNYFRLATLESTLEDFGVPIVESLLIKGLKSFPGHTDIKNKFRQFVKDDLVKIEQSFEENGNLESAPHRTLLKKWITLVDSENEVIACLEKETVKKLYLFWGKRLVDKKKYQEALNNYQKALDIMPNHPDVHISIADVYFTVEDFDSGLQFLKKAVSIDKKYAVYWYNMGKNLQGQNDYNGAILAYEQYFMATPENSFVLKDIGDCHKIAGNLESAREAYQQFKKLNSSV